MSEETRHDIQIKIERFHLSVNLKSIFFPLDFLELLPVLEEAGYSVHKDLVERIRDIPAGVRAFVGGTIAEKADAGQTFRLDPDRGIMGISGQDVNGIIEDFSNFEKLVKDKLNVDLQKEAYFYEFLAEGSATTGRDPTSVIAKLFQDSRLQSEMSKILGFSVTNFGVRIVEQNRLVTGSQWFDFRIEPYIPKPDTSYRISATYRHPKRTNVMLLAKSLRKTFEELLFVIEREA